MSEKCLTIVITESGLVEMSCVCGYSTQLHLDLDSDTPPTQDPKVMGRIKAFTDEHEYCIDTKH